ncbi:MAG TPA: tRNA uridine-5-carboxymethylaminomethyl(34) synthesis GTPase MnmE [Devosia sp.]|nr:tRNA uridine-5-carboxymethylaminomethyl(34) synthesis GTPase MnmE [Devosia sp.]
MSSSDTIVALSSGSLPSGVAVIRLSGPATGELVTGLAGTLPSPRRLTLETLRIGGGPVDTEHVAWFPGPHSFTGEDCAKLQVHGSPAVVRRLLRHLSAQAGTRLAEAGEFTRRAFENGKLDLTEVEGLGDLISAETESQRQQALARLAGGLSRQLESWRHRLLGLRAEIEAQLDFSDEGDVGQLPVDYGDNVAALETELRAAAESVGRGRIVREGLRVALAGPPNAGKSSLLNALARSDVAIVTDEAGTTRDVREVPIDVGGQLVVLIDMAGLRETSSKAEAEGVRRAREELGRADLVLWLSAPDAHTSPDTILVPMWQIATKSDLGVAPGELSLSTATGDGVAALIARLGAFAAAAIGAGEPVLVSRERDLAALESAAAALMEARTQVDDPELAAESLRRASQALERLLGRMDAESVLDRLFSSFCIGK